MVLIQASVKGIAKSFRRGVVTWGGTTGLEGPCKGSDQGPMWVFLVLLSPWSLGLGSGSVYRAFWPSPRTSKVASRAELLRGLYSTWTPDAATICASRLAYHTSRHQI